MNIGFPFFHQLDAVDCGPACLKMICAFHGKHFDLQFLREKCYINKEGVSLKGVSECAELIGLRSLAVKIPYGNNSNKPCLLAAPMPVIAYWNQNHFIVIYKVTKLKVYIADPASGKYCLNRTEFEKSWICDHDSGIILLLEKGLNFNSDANIFKQQNRIGFSFLLPYLTPFRQLSLQIFLGLFVGAILQLVFPILTQSIVDIGIDSKDLNFISLILIGQMAIFVGQTVVKFIQSWIILHISARISVNLIGDFLTKLMKLPLGYFDTKHMGDLMQRIGDHHRIESFLTQSFLSIIFSIFNICLFGILLAFYSTSLFMVFLIASVAYFIWIFIFLKFRKEIDYAMFQKNSINQDNLFEIVQGMAEIKLQGSHLKHKWKWAQTQASLFHSRIKSLILSQYQDSGGLAINQLKDILITALSAKAVIDGKMTIGMMLSVQYIIGQLNGPLQQMITFIRAAQDAKISLERLGEIHLQENEEKSGDNSIRDIISGDLSLENISFRYTPVSEYVLKNINCKIPHGKVTAIVGASGSGKTTLIKLLLGFYDSSEGEIFLDKTPFSILHMQSWRDLCGAVLQDGYIFSDNIANNIAESDDIPNYKKIKYASELANIKEFIENLPLGYKTLIGAKGNGISQGQKQRLLIARAIYKNPDFLFFDEATNSLDSKNERVITENLKAFYKGKTVVIVAHRLSTVKDADQIIVLDKGSLEEIGTHNALVEKKGTYYELVKNQLELGN